MKKLHEKFEHDVDMNITQNLLTIKGLNNLDNVYHDIANNITSNPEFVKNLAYYIYSLTILYSESFIADTLKYHDGMVARDFVDSGFPEFDNLFLEYSSRAQKIILRDTVSKSIDKLLEKELFCDRVV